jgi:hypothetical protein
MHIWAASAQSTPPKTSDSSTTFRSLFAGPNACMALAFLVIDCGSSSCRAAVAVRRTTAFRPAVTLSYNPCPSQEASSRQIVPGTLQQHPFSLDDNTEFDAEELMSIVVDVAVRSLKAASQTRPDLAVGLVGVSVFAVTIICLDSDMKPLWKACSYADKRTFTFAESSRSKMRPEQLQELSVPPLAPPTKIHSFAPPDMPPLPVTCSYEATGTPLAYPYASCHIQRLRSSKPPQQWYKRVAAPAFFRVACHAHSA